MPERDTADDALLSFDDLSSGESGRIYFDDVADVELEEIIVFLSWAFYRSGSN